MKVYFYRETDSTNLQAKRLAEEGAPHGTVVTADMQTAGRGRRGRGWEAPAGANVALSLVLRPEISPDRASMLTLVMALAVCQAIEEETGIQPLIKWPNDIVLNGKKIVGILTEMNVAPKGTWYVICGVGINVKPREFPEELRDKATTLETEVGREISREKLIEKIMVRFEAAYERFTESQDITGLLEAYNRRLVNAGRKVRVLDPKGEFEGTALGINPVGELLVETEDGKVREVYAGEVSVRGINGYV